MAAPALDRAEYWGHLIAEDRTPTLLFQQLLSSIADYIVKNFAPFEDDVLSPAKLASYYRRVGANYDGLFLESLPSSISFIYRSLGCFHSLQPGSDPYAAPSIPALTVKGFIRWQTVQLLLNPQEHVPYLQAAVRDFDLIRPVTGLESALAGVELFPKSLPFHACPRVPDPDTCRWHDSVGEQLKQASEGAHDKPFVPSTAPPQAQRYHHARPASPEARSVNTDASSLSSGSPTSPRGRPNIVTVSPTTTTTARPVRPRFATTTPFANLNPNSVKSPHPFSSHVKYDLPTPSSPIAAPRFTYASYPQGSSGPAEAAPVVEATTEPLTTVSSSSKRPPQAPSAATAPRSSRSPSTTSSSSASSFATSARSRSRSHSPMPPSPNVPHHHQHHHRRPHRSISPVRSPRIYESTSPSRPSQTAGTAAAASAADPFARRHSTHIPMIVPSAVPDYIPAEANAAAESQKTDRERGRGDNRASSKRDVTILSPHFLSPTGSTGQGYRPQISPSLQQQQQQQQQPRPPHTLHHVRPLVVQGVPITERQAGFGGTSNGNSSSHESMAGMESVISPPLYRMPSNSIRPAGDMPLSQQSRQAPPAHLKNGMPPPSVPPSSFPPSLSNQYSSAPLPQGPFAPRNNVTNVSNGFAAGVPSSASQQSRDSILYPRTNPAQNIIWEDASAAFPAVGANTAAGQRNPRERSASGTRLARTMSAQAVPMGLAAVPGLGPSGGIGGSRIRERSEETARRVAEVVDERPWAREREVRERDRDGGGREARGGWRERGREKDWDRERDRDRGDRDNRERDRDREKAPRDRERGWSQSRR